MVTGRQQVVDIGIDPLDERRRRRRSLARIGVPVGGVALMVATILAIAVYSDRANRAGALALSNELLVTLEARIGNEVSGYLDAPGRAVRILRDTLRDRALGDRLPLAQSAAASLLREVPQIANLNFADADGNFVLVREGRNGGIDVKRVENSPAARRVLWIHRNAAGAETGREEDAKDTFDPRTRPWYAGALASDKLFWTDVYIFFTQHVPGITASAKYRARDGRPYVFGADITLDALSHFLASLKIGRTGRAIIMDDAGRLIAAPPSGRGMPGPPGGGLGAARVDEFGDKVLTHAYDRFRIAGAGHRVIAVDGRRYISAVTPIAGAGRDWSVMIVVPEDDFVGFVARNNRKALWMSVAIVAVATALAALLARQGLRADRSARLLLDRQAAIARQSRAFATLASDASLFDPARNLPPRTLTETLADAAGARRASVWGLTGGGRILRSEDSFDRETAGHVDGLELHRDELPALFDHLLGGEEVEVADAARDRRTAELHRVLSAFGSRALLAVPIRRNGRVVGSIWVEDAPAAEASRDFVRAVANMVALRMTETPAGPAPRAPAVAGTATAFSDTATRSFAADLRHAEIDASKLHAELYPATAVMVLRFTDAAAMAARLSGASRSICDEIACGLQQIATDNGIPYLKLAGHEIVAAAGFDPAEAGAAPVIADMALRVRDRCVVLFENSEHALEFQIGIDCNLAIGGPVGSEPRGFNLWGHAVRTAGIMAASALPGSVQATEAAYSRLRQDFLFRPRGSFYLPHVGEARTFVLAGRL